MELTATCDDILRSSAHVVPVGNSEEIVVPLLVPCDFAILDDCELPHVTGVVDSDPSRSFTGQFVGRL